MYIRALILNQVFLNVKRGFISQIKFLAKTAWTIKSGYKIDNSLRIIYSTVKKRLTKQRTKFGNPW